MKSPLWIINSILIAILVAMAIFILYSIKNITQRPRIGSIKVMPRPEVIKKEVLKPKDLRVIYEENDLFGTFKQAIIPEKAPEVIPQLPKPPAPKPVITPQPPPIQFLEPLPIKITGIIASSNEAKSQVSIMNNNTKKTESYRVGDKLFDAYIIRIFPKKIIIIRSNGQQETLFMFAPDAQAEIKSLQDPAWHEVIQRQTDYTYLVNPSTLASRLSSLAEFIDMVDITTAFKKGHSVGIRIGRMDSKSIGYALGFMPGDIITKIQEIAPTTTKNRLQIYTNLTQAEIGTKITVEFSRRGQPLTNEYTLFSLPDTTELTSFTPPKQAETLPLLPTKTVNEAQQVKQALMENVEENQQSDTAYAYELRKRDRQAMHQFGGKDAFIKPGYAS